MKVKFAFLLAAINAANIDATNQADIEVDAEIDEEPKVLS